MEVFPFAIKVNLLRLDFKFNIFKETLVEGKKQKIAILLSYSGRDYYGLQHNPGDEEHVTIEWKLFEALVAAKVVYSNILQERKKCSYTSCSRTDKGVRKSFHFVPMCD